MKYNKRNKHNVLETEIEKKVNLFSVFLCHESFPVIFLCGLIAEMAAVYDIHVDRLITMIISLFRKHWILNKHHDKTWKTLVGSSAAIFRNTMIALSRYMPYARLMLNLVDIWHFF